MWRLTGKDDTGWRWSWKCRNLRFSCACVWNCWSQTVGDRVLKRVTEQSVWKTNKGLVLQWFLTPVISSKLNRKDQRSWVLLGKNLELNFVVGMSLCIVWADTLYEEHCLFRVFIENSLFQSMGWILNSLLLLGY